MAYRRGCFGHPSAGFGVVSDWRIKASNVPSIFTGFEFAGRFFFGRRLGGVGISTFYRSLRRAVCFRPDLLSAGHFMAKAYRTVQLKVIEHRDLNPGEV